MLHLDDLPEGLTVGHQGDLDEANHGHLEGNIKHVDMALIEQRYSTKEM